MAQLATINPLNQFFALNGSPLNNGKLYFGTVNADPEQNPVQMYWDAAGLVPALQPIRTTSGYPSRSGSPAILYCDVEYSLRVRQSNDVQVFYVPRAGSASLQTFVQWQPTNVTPSYASATTFTLTGDQTADFQQGRRARFAVTAGTVYGTISSAVYGSLTTVTMIMDGSSVLDSGLTSVDLSLLTPINDALPRNTLPIQGQLFGFTMSTTGPSTTMTIGSGSCANSNGSVVLSRSSSIAKTTAAWAVGTAAGGLDTGTAIGSALGATSSFATSIMTCTVAPSSGTFQVGQTVVADGVTGGTTITSLGTGTGGTGTYNLSTTPGTLSARPTNGLSWYHFFVMRRPDTGVVDGACSRSPTAPTVGGAIPAAYTQYRRIGAGLLNGSAQWTLFVQDGDLFQWASPPLDINQTTSGLSAVLRGLTVPPGISVRAQINAQMTAGGSGEILYVSDPSTTDLAPVSSAVSPLNSMFTGASSTTSAQITVRTNTSGQIRTRQAAGGATETFRGATVGWFDTRGRDA